MTKSDWHKIAMQALSIILTALVAAAISALQAIAAQAIPHLLPVTNPVETATLGGALRSGWLAIQTARNPFV